MIKKESIENLKNHLDVVDVVSQFIELKKTGANFKACCPFHGNPLRKIEALIGSLALLFQRSAFHLAMFLYRCFYIAPSKIAYFQSAPFRIAHF